MTKIIQLHPKSPSYQKLNQSMIKQLNQFEEKLMKGIINLAMNGEWTQLNDSTETGSICSFYAGAIAEITDPSVVALRELQEKLTQTIIILEKNKQ